MAHFADRRNKASQLRQAESPPLEHQGPRPLLEGALPDGTSLRRTNMYRTCGLHARFFFCGGVVMDLLYVLPIRHTWVLDFCASEASGKAPGTYVR